MKPHREVNGSVHEYLKIPSPSYLIGAPLACAGLNNTVIVVAVSLREASTPS